MSVPSLNTTVTTREPVLRDRADLASSAAGPAIGALDRDADVLLDLDRRQRGRGGDHLHLHVGDVRAPRRSAARSAERTPDHRRTTASPPAPAPGCAATTRRSRSARAWPSARGPRRRCSLSSTLLSVHAPCVTTGSPSAQALQDLHHTGARRPEHHLVQFERARPRRARTPRSRPRPR